MTETFDDIFNLEDAEQYDKAFDAYLRIYSKTNPDYQVWKHFYFFLWTLIEEGTDEFNEKINLQKLLLDSLKEGQFHFDNLADFNFIAGYTICIFPYEYGEYKELQKTGKQMLLKATQLEPKNPIFKMCYLGCTENRDQRLYNQAVIEAAPKVLETFSSKGCLNRYFREVLYREDNKAYR